MKSLFRYLVPVAAAAIALVSCQPKEEQIGNDPAGEVTIRVHATADNLKAGDQETKTYIDSNNTIIWGTGEYMKLALTAGETTTFANSTDASADIFNGAPEAMFEFSVSPATASEYVYQGLYPASAAASSNNENAANYKVNLPTIQNATASSYDPAAYIMVAKPESFNVVQTDWEASFRRGTALNKITLKNVPSGVSFNKVKITAAGKKLAGGRHFNLTTGEGSDVYGSEATIEVLYATPLSGTNVDVWFTSWDAIIAEGEPLTIVAYTTDNKSYTKEITARTGGIKFQEGYLNTLGASLSGITAQVVSSLDGDYVILAKKDDSTFYALKGEASGTRIASVNYDGSLTSYNGDASIVWTIATSGTGYTIKNGSNYVGWTSGSGNAADLIAEADYDADKCLMGIDDNGDGTYKIYVAADTGRILARNQSNAYFAFYSNSQYKDLVLVPATSMEQVKTPTFSEAEGTVASGTTVTISTETSGATIYYTTDGSTPSSTSGTQGTSVTINATTTIKAIAVKTGMADSEVATATYSVSGGSGTVYYEKVTTAPADWSGEYLMVCESENKALSAISNTSTKYGIGSDVSISGGKIESTTIVDAYKVTIAKATNSGTGYTLDLSGSYLAWTSGNSLNASSSESDNSRWTITAGATSGNWIIANVADSAREIWYNTGSPRFACYTGKNESTSGYAAIQLYKLDNSSVPSITWNLESISVTTPPTKTTYTEGESFNPSGMVVTGHFVDADDATNTKDEAVTGYTITPDGALTVSDTQVTITYQGKTATQNITVNAAPAGNDGSLEHPYTASEARALALNGDTGSYYISGIVTKIQNQYSASYGTANFWIDENGTDQTVFEGYKIKYFGNVNWVEGNAEIALNDEVIIYGTLTVYTNNNNSTPETSSGYLVSLNGKTKGLTLAAPTVTTNDSAKQITVVWTAATGTTSAISYVVTCGTQTYNASAAGSHTFTMAAYGHFDISVVASSDDAISATAVTSATLSDPSSTTKDYYKLVTSISDITAGTYVVGALRSTSATNDFYFAKASVSSGDWVVSDAAITVAESNGVRKFEIANLPSGAVEFTLTGDNTNGFTISHGSDYLYYTAASNRKLAFAASGSSQKWTVSAKSSPLINGGVVLKAVGSQNYTISENSTATGAIRGYASTTEYRAIYLFKKVNE